MRRFFLLAFILTFSGCATLHDTSGKAEITFLPVPPEMPRELQKTTLPDYVIEPPDVLRIEVARMVPKSPYQLNAGDGIGVQVSRADGTIVLDDVFRVELDGSLQFGAPFDEPNQSEDPALRVDGPISVGGLDMTEARKLIREHIGKSIAEHLSG